MSWIKKHRPSPSMMIAGGALIAALAGTAVAGPLAEKSVLSSADKKQVKKIAKGQVNTLAPGLSVASAQNATNATNAQNATNANNANALSGVTLPNLSPAVQAGQASCTPLAGMGFDDCNGATLTTARTADLFVIVTGTWYSPVAADGNAEVNCRIERDDVASSQTYTFGTENDDTIVDQYERALTISELDANQPAGTYLYELSCNQIENNINLSTLETTVFALGS